MLLAVDLLTQWKTDDFFNRKKRKTFFCELENNYQTHNHKIHNGDAEILFINFWEKEMNKSSQPFGCIKLTSNRWSK